MTTNHTPGPWTVDDVTSRGEHIYFRVKAACQDRSIAGVYKDPCSAANARLIAAAPELLTALERVARLNPAAGEIGAGMLATIVSEARVAIARANGEA